MKAVIFDFDGTIVDTETLWVDVYQEIIKEKYNVSIPISIFEACVGTVDDALYDYLVTFVDATITRQQLSPIAEKNVDKKLCELMPRQGVIELLTSLRDSGYRLAIASGSQRKWIDLFLKQHHLNTYFEEICCADDVENVKPHPDIYLATLQALNLQPEQCFAIEDSINGSLAALSAKILCYIVPNEVTKHSTFPQGTIRVNHFSDIPHRAH